MMEPCLQPGRETSSSTRHTTTNNNLDIRGNLHTHTTNSSVKVSSSYEDMHRKQVKESIPFIMMSYGPTSACICLQQFNPRVGLGMETLNSSLCIKCIMVKRGVLNRLEVASEFGYPRLVNLSLC